MQWHQISRWRAVLMITLPVLFIGGMLVGGLVMPGGVFRPPVLPTLSPDAHRLKIRENLQQNRLAQALYQVEALAARVGWSAELHEQAATIWEQLGDDEQALFHWAQAAESAPTVPRLRASAEGYLARQKWGAAADTLVALLDMAPENTWANFHLGMLRVPYDASGVEGHLRQAALDPLYNEAARAVRVAVLEQSRQDVQTEIRRPMLVGLAMVDHELWAYAELAFEEANTLSLALDGQPLADALGYMGFVRGKQGKDGTAAMTQAVQLAPNNANIRYLLALYYRTQQNYRASKDAMVQAVGLAPDNPALYAELGTAYRLIGEYETAEHWLQTAVQTSGGDERFRDVLGAFYAEEGVNLGSDGLAAIAEALDDTPDDPNLLAGQAWALFVLGNQADGRTAIEQVLEQTPDNTLAQFYKARMLLASGEDDAQARQLLEQVAASGAGVSAEARRILDAL